MSLQELLEKFAKIKVWKRGSQRAPHKPLLILYAIGRLLRQEPRLVSYEEVDQEIGKLLREFGPKINSYHPENPFCYLRTDGLWNLQDGNKIMSGMGAIRKRELLDLGIQGGFQEELQKTFEEHPEWALEIAKDLLTSHFPESLHEDILMTVGIDQVLPNRITEHRNESRRRDPFFRQEVLRTYEYSCAVCGFNVRLGNTPVALEAAHIRWHQAQGPDQVNNGLALCSLHHKLFDRGAYTLDSSLRVHVSDEINGTGAEETLWAFHGKTIRRPRQELLYPDLDHVDWHVREVFQGSYTPLQS